MKGGDIRASTVLVVLVFAFVQHSVQSFKAFSLYQGFGRKNGFHSVRPSGLGAQCIGALSLVSKNECRRDLRIWPISAALEGSDGDNGSNDVVSVVLQEEIVNGSKEGLVNAEVPSDDEKIRTVPFPIVLWRFTRPHTLIGSALAVPALHLLAAPSFNSVWTMRNLISMLYVMVPALLMNLYITGLNQITDVDIDKINKPNLPIAAGILSQRDAICTCVIALILSLYMGTFAHPIYSTRGLQVALWGSGILGTLYSLKPFRLKRYPFLAAFCIVAVRGTIINASFFAHAMAAVFGQPSATVLSCLLTNARCCFSSIFFGIFGVVIALMKDVPDVLGDKVSNVRTFSVRVGPERVFHISRAILTGLFSVCSAGFLQLAFTAGKNPLLAACRLFIALCSVVAAVSVNLQSNQVDPKSPSQVYEYYMHLWKIFYLSYLVLPLAR
jgi:homogentisate phytyltransferase / homogentisate geranylgeranyltransferase